MERNVEKIDSLSSDKYYPYLIVEHFTSFVNEEERTKGGATGGAAGRKSTIIFEKILDSSEYNFKDMETYSLRVVYNRENLAVYLWKDNVQGIALIDQKLKLDNLMDFDMGKAFVGMLPDGYNTSFNIDLLKWKITCFNVFNSEDSWNGLTIKYEESWPSKLILSNQILE